MKYVVCYSGGHSSAAAAVECVRRYGKDNVILLNHDISGEVEHADIKRFKREVASYLALEITCANMENYEKLPPLKLCRKLNAFQYRPGQAVCTRMLKTEPFRAWLNAHFPEGSGCKIVYGFDANEKERITRRVGVMAVMGYECEFPLLRSERTIYRIEETGIARPVTYKLFRHANCIGCLKAGRQHWYLVYCLYPHIFNEAKEAEREIGHSIIKDIYLEELEPKFREMRSTGICPNETEQPQSFWARVERQIPEQESLLPCECSF